MLKLVPNQKESACLLSSDFPTENPLTQTRTFHTPTVVTHLTKPLKIERIKKTNRPNHRIRN